MVEIDYYLNQFLKIEKILKRLNAKMCKDPEP